MLFQKYRSIMLAISSLVIGGSSLIGGVVNAQQYRFPPPDALDQPGSPATTVTKQTVTLQPGKTLTLRPGSGRPPQTSPLMPYGRPYPGQRNFVPAVPPPLGPPRNAPYGAPLGPYAGPAPRPGTRPPVGPGARPIAGPVARPPVGPGARPFTGPGARPPVGPGARPFTGPGARPPVGPGARPFTGPGARPPVGPGDRPFAGPGARPPVGPGARPFAGPGPEAMPARPPGAPSIEPPFGPPKRGPNQGPGNSGPYGNNSPYGSGPRNRSSFASNPMDNFGFGPFNRHEAPWETWPFGGRDSLWNRKELPFKDKTPGEWVNMGDPKEGMAIMWEDLISAPDDLGEMPGGWYVPSISVPNPVDLEDQLEEASKEIPDLINIYY